MATDAPVDLSVPFFTTAKPGVGQGWRGGKGGGQTAPKVSRTKVTRGKNISRSMVPLTPVAGLLFRYGGRKGGALRPRRVKRSWEGSGGGGPGGERRRGKRTLAQDSPPVPTVSPTVYLSRKSTTVHWKIFGESAIFGGNAEQRGALGGSRPSEGKLTPESFSRRAQAK